MNVQTAVRQQLGLWHGALGQMMSDCSEDALHKTLPQSTITSIASIFGHIVFSEDVITNAMLQGKPPIYQSDGWEAKTGVPFLGMPPEMNPEWARSIKMDVPSFMEYANAVYAATDKYLDTVAEGDLQNKVQTPLGDQTVGWTIAMLLGTHAPQHAGEIAALKGVQGLKGLPF